MNRDWSIPVVLAIRLKVEDTKVLNPVVCPSFDEGGGIHHNLVLTLYRTHVCLLSNSERAIFFRFQ